MVLIVVLYALFATTFILAKSVLLSIKPLLFIGMRMTIAGSILLAYQAVKGDIKVIRSSWFLLGQIIIFHIFIAYVFEFWALQFISASKTALIYTLSPFITALLALVIAKERLTRVKWAGLIIGCAGLVPWVLTTDICWQTVRVISLPELVLLIAVISAAYGWIIVDQLMRRFSYGPTLINGIGMLGGGLCALVVSFLIEGRPVFAPLYQMPSCDQPVYFMAGLSPVWHVIIYGGALIIIANIICYNLYGYLLRYYSATFLSFAGFMCPFFAAIIGRIFFNEAISTNFIISFCLIFIGLFIFYMQELFMQKSIKKGPH